MKRFSRHIFNSGEFLRRWTIVALVGVGTVIGAGLGPVAQGGQGDMCSVTKRALEEASRVRGLTATETVPCRVHSRQEVEGFLKTIIAEKFPKDTLEMEQLEYRALGIVPDEYDYVNGIVSAYVQQIGGYYDPDKKLFVMLDTMPESLQLPVAVHELTHALQDQKFNLTKFLDPSKMNNDELMARAALVEGDASAVMQDFVSSRRYKEREKRDSSAVEVPVSVPPALQRVLLFPYLQGLSFARRIIREGGYAAINGAFARPPSTSREILHPEQYITRAFIPRQLDVQSVEGPAAGDSPIFVDTVGEFVISSLLGEALSSQTRGERCAEGWRRDRVGIFNEKSGGKLVSWRSEWDSEGEAQEFAECYREMLKVRYQKDVQRELLAVSSTKKMRIVQEGALVSVMAAVTP